MTSKPIVINPGIVIFTGPSVFDPEHQVAIQVSIAGEIGLVGLVGTRWQRFLIRLLEKSITRSIEKPPSLSKRKLKKLIFRQKAKQP
jgi:hypothetical protein